MKTGLFALMLASAAQAQTTFVSTVRDSYPVPSPDGTQVAFQSNRSGESALWLMRADGTQLHRLDVPHTDPSTPDFSPDGTRLVYAARSGDSMDGATGALWVLDLSSAKTARVPLPKATDIGHPKWTPDGTRIVFDSNHATPDPSLPWQQQWQDVYSVKPDGSDLQRHTECKAICTYAQFSPDGKQLLYRKVLAQTGFNWVLDVVDYNSEIFVADADGSDARNLSKHAAFDGWPSWSPDGKAIVFASARTGRPREAALFVVAVASGETRRISPEGRSFAQPRFAPDGKSVWACNNVEWADGAGTQIETGGIVRLPL